MHCAFRVVLVALLLAAARGQRAGTDHEWMYLDDVGEKVGPVDTDHLKGLFYTGKLKEDDKVYQMGDTEWRLLTDHKDVHKLMRQDRAIDPRSDVLYDADLFGEELSAVSVDAISSVNDDVFCAKRGAFGEMLKKTRLRALVTSMVPELQAADDEIKQLRAEYQDLVLDVKDVEREHNQTLARAVHGQKLAAKRINAIKDALYAIQNEPRLLRMYANFRGMVMKSFRLNENLLQEAVWRPLQVIPGAGSTTIVLLTLLLGAVLKSCLMPSKGGSK